MHDERDVEFTPSPEMGAAAGGVEFTPAPGLESATTPGPAGAAIDQAKAAAQRLVGDAQQRTTEQVQTHLDGQKTRAAESLSGVAQSLRTTSRQLTDAPAGLGGFVQQTGGGAALWLGCLALGLVAGGWSLASARARERRAAELRITPAAASGAVRV